MQGPQSVRGTGHVDGRGLTLDSKKWIGPTPGVLLRLHVVHHGLLANLDVQIGQHLLKVVDLRQGEPSARDIDRGAKTGQNRLALLEEVLHSSQVNVIEAMQWSGVR